MIAALNKRKDLNFLAEEEMVVADKEGGGSECFLNIVKKNKIELDTKGDESIDEKRERLLYELLLDTAKTREQSLWIATQIVEFNALSKVNNLESSMNQHDRVQLEESLSIAAAKRKSRQWLVFAFVAFIIGVQGLHSLFAYADAANLTVAITAPAAGATVGGIQAINATASDTVGIAGVRFRRDSTNLGAEDTTAPYSVNWNTAGLQNCSSHTLSAIARNTANQTLTVTEKVTVQNGAAVSITAPAAGATVAGTVPFTANRTGSCVLLGVQFQVDGVNIGIEDTSAPYRVNLNTTTLANGPHTLTAIGRQASGSTTATETIQVNNAAQLKPPTVSITAPAPGVTVSGIQAINATASDATGVAGVQFKVDGTNLGVEVATVPYGTNWNTAGLQNCSLHTISAIARNTGNITATAIETVTVQNGVAVSITAPAAGAAVSGTVPFTASANGACALLGVQFQVDGVNIGAEDTSSPYSVNLDTTSLTNGSHTLTTIGRQAGGLTTATETIQVNNISSSPGNIILNPSFETASGGQPTDWSYGSFGTNTRTFSYLNTGHTGSHSVRMEITAYTSGGALVSSTERLIAAGGRYLYTEWYQSNVNTEVDADITLSDGTTQSYFLGTVLASPTAWSQSKFEIDMPANAVSITVYPVLYSKGWTIRDDISLASYTPTPLNRGLVSITFDDGYTSQYTNAFQALLKNKYGLALNATFYIISGYLTSQPTYMTTAQVIDLLANGMEIGSHTVTHPSLPTLSQASLINEMSQSQQTLQTAIGTSVNDFAYPYGDYDANTIAVGKQYYQSQRTSDNGFNTKDLLDLTRLKIQAVNNGTTLAQVKAWVDQAIRDKTWLILVYHQIEFTQPLPVGDLYTTLPADLDAELQYIKDSGVGVVTMDQAIREILLQ